jgi:hypothetical protein
MACPACMGKGFRLMRIGPDQGLCPTCGGAGSVLNTGDTGTWASSVTPCTACGGSGLRPLRYGGTRDGLEPIGGHALNASPGGGGSSDGGTDRSEAKKGDGDDPYAVQSFFSRYKTLILIAAAVVLIVGLIGVKSSRK